MPPHRPQPTDPRIAALFEPPNDRPAMVRHYTLSAAELALVRKGRSDHNRLGLALMLSYLRDPGRPLKVGERPAEALTLTASSPNSSTCRRVVRLSGTGKCHKEKITSSQCVA